MQNTVEVWDSSDEDDSSTTVTTQDHADSLPPLMPQEKSSRIFLPLRHLFIFVLLWQAVFKISNSALSSLLRFCKYFLLVLGRAFQSQDLISTSNAIPSTLSTVQKVLGISDSQCFTEYVVCPKCDSIYELEDCVVKLANGDSISRTCCHIATPSHPHLSRRQPCGAVLLKRIRRYTLRPIKSYPYRPLKRSIGILINRLGFIEMCEHWRKRQTTVPEKCFGDIYDGEVLKTDFKEFLETPHSYLLTINVDCLSLVHNTQLVPFILLFRIFQGKSATNSKM